MAKVSDICGDYTLTKVNGDATSEKVDINFASTAEDTVRLQTRVVNRVGGNVKLEGSKLKGMLMSTRMAGPPALMKIEGTLTMGFMEGMDYTLEDGVLTLSHGPDSLTFAKK